MDTSVVRRRRGTSMDSKSGESVGGAEQRVDGAFGVGHHAEHVPVGVHDAGDVAHGAVRIRAGRRRPPASGVAEDDVAVSLESVERRVVGGVAPVTVRDRHAQDLARRRSGSVNIVSVSSTRMCTHSQTELEAGVAQQRAGEQPGLAGDLEAVADGEHRSAALRVRDDLLHDRAEARDRAGAQIVAVAEAAGQDDDVDSLEIVSPCARDRRPSRRAPR